MGHSYYYYLSVDLGVMAMKGYSTVAEAQKLEPHHLMQFSDISWA